MSQLVRTDPVTLHEGDFLSVSVKTSDDHGSHNLDKKLVLKVDEVDVGEGGTVEVYTELGLVIFNMGEYAWTVEQ